MDNIIDDSRAASYVNNLNYFKFTSDPTKEHLYHCEKGRFVVDVFTCSLIDKLKHFVGRHVSVCVTDAPLKLLQVRFPLDLADYCHVRFGYDQVRSSFEPELLVKRYCLHAVSYLSKENWLFISMNRSHVFI